jgi:hypothetical protein
MKWQANYAKLAVFETVHGTCNVPSKYKEDLSLAWFVKGQRRFKKGLTDGQRALLDGIGFEWARRNISSRSAAETNQPAVTNAMEGTSQESQAAAAAAAAAVFAAAAAAAAAGADVTTPPQLKSPPQDTLEKTASGASEEEPQQFGKEGVPIHADKSPGGESGATSLKACMGSLSNPARARASRIDDDQGALLQVSSTDGSETETPPRTADAAIMLNDNDDLANKKKKAEDCGDKVPVEVVRHHSQAKTEESDQESDTDDEGGNQHPVEGDFVPRSVYLEEKNSKRKYKEYAMRYKTKAARYYDERNKLRREVKRLKLELHGLNPDSQVLVSAEGVEV